MSSYPCFVYIFAFQGASSNVNIPNKKMTTSFGGSTSTSKGYSGKILQRSRDKSETLGMYSSYKIVV